MKKHTANTLFIIDGSSFLYRAYYGLRPLHTPQGETVQAVYGFCRMIKKMIDKFDPKNMVVVWDSKGKNKRHEIFPEYKATRQAPPSDLFSQKAHIIEFATAIGLAQYSESGIEADDLMYSVATWWTQHHTDGDVIIITSDKDMGQVITDKITLYDSFKDVFIDKEFFTQTMGFEPQKTTFYFSLVGDSSDNIPGVQGIGKKGAQELVQQFDSLAHVYERIETLTSKRLKTALVEHKQDALLSQQLFTLHIYSLDIQKSTVAFDLAHWSNARGIFTQLHFTSLLKELPVEYRQQQMFSGSSYVNDSSAYNFICITTEVELANVLAQIRTSKLFAYDTETDSVNAQQTNLVGVSLCLVVGTAYYIPCGHVTDEQQLSREHVVQELKSIFEDSSIAKIAHHAKFDELVLTQYGIHVQNTIFDTMIAALLVKQEWQGIGLKELSQIYLNENMLSFEQMVFDKKLKNFSYVQLQDATRYAAADAHQTLALYYTLQPLLVEKKQHDLYANIELPLIQVLTALEERGIYCDTTVLRDLDVTVSMHLDQVYKTIVGLIPPDQANINLNSPKQVEDLLFTVLQLPHGRKSSKTSSYSTDQEVLGELAKIHPIPAYILHYRELFKLKSTYIDALPNYINKRTGRIHTTFNQFRVATGRLASSEPNLQNIPAQGVGKQVRAAFKPSDDNQLFISADYGQVELRILAYLTQDVALLDAFNNNKDIHKETAAGIFGVDLDAVTDEQRNVGKRINFSILYGLTPYGLSKDLDISLKDAKQFIDAYFAHYVQVRPWMDSIIQQAKIDGYVTTFFGRRRFVPELKERNKNLYELGCRIAVNTVVQGTSAEIMKIGMIRVHELLKNRYLHAHIVLQIHDQILIECDAKDAEIIQQSIKQELESVVQWNLPLIVSTGIGKSWKDAE